MKLFTRIFAYLFFACFAAGVLAIVGAWLLLGVLLDDKPLVTQFESTSLEDLRRIKSLAIDFSQQSDTSANKQVVLNERDINLALGHFLPLQVKLPKDTFIKVELAKQDDATITATLPASYVAEQAYNQYQQDIPAVLLPLAQWLRNRIDRDWLNAHWHMRVNNVSESAQWVTTRALGLGGIKLNQDLSNYIVETIYRQSIERPDLRLARQSWQNLRGLEIIDSKLGIEFMLPTQGVAALNSYQALVLSADEQALIEIYSQKLASLPGSGPLVRVLAPLFQFASQRSSQSNDPVAENRGALLALSKKYGGDQLLNLLQTSPGKALGTIPKPYTIYARRDLAQHLVLSAGLSLIANQQLAELIGIDKEMSDLLRGQNISAWDLLADKAGVRLAENATHSARSARDVQLLLGRARQDKHLLPDLGAEFKFSEDRFGADDLTDLELMIELYLEQHKVLQKQL